MNYIIESIIVGFYCLILYLFFSLFIKNFYLLLLVVGFFKHFIASKLGVHTWFCNNGYACLKVNNTNNTYQASEHHLFIESMLEAIAFFIVGVLLHITARNFLSNDYLFFGIGIILHLISEQLLIHKFFCLHNCHKTPTN